MRNGGFAQTTMATDPHSDVEKQPNQIGDCGAPLSEHAAASQSHDLGGKIIELVVVAEPQFSRNSSSHEQCRVCQEDKEETLINLGCQCRGGLANAHQSCIMKWFCTRGSNKCEICQQVAANIEPPDSQTSTWVWRVDPGFRELNTAQERERACFSPIWVAFSILIGGLLLDVIISITLGVSALPVNIIIGVIVVLGLGTALRLALEFCQEWNLRRVVHRAEANANLGYHPAV